MSLADEALVNGWEMMGVFVAMGDMWTVCKLKEWEMRTKL